MIERVDAGNMFLHLDTCHMLDGREHLTYIHLAESDRSTPGWGTCDWDEIYATLAAIGFSGGSPGKLYQHAARDRLRSCCMAPGRRNFEDVMENVLPFLRGNARQFRLL